MPTEVFFHVVCSALMNRGGLEDVEGGDGATGVFIFLVPQIPTDVLDTLFFTDTLFLQIMA